MLNEYTEFDFKRVVKQSDSLKIAIGGLMWFKDLHFFSWLLLKKMQDKSLKQFKIVKIGPGLLFPVQVTDKSAKVIIDESDSPKNTGFSAIGQLLEHTHFIST